MSDAKYKGSALFDTTGNSQSVALGGRGAAMSFGVGQIAYSSASDESGNANAVFVKLDSGVASLQVDPWASGQATDALTSRLEKVQGLINNARVQAGSQYAAIESAINYTTDLTAQYELGFNSVNDVNFSMETAHLAKNQILQQAATAMLAQANQGQQGLLQLLA